VRLRMHWVRRAQLSRWSTSMATRQRRWAALKWAWLRAQLLQMSAPHSTQCQPTLIELEVVKTTPELRLSWPLQVRGELAAKGIRSIAISSDITKADACERCACSL
jgi:hypothetical protein